MRLNLSTSRTLESENPTYAINFIIIHVPPAGLEPATRGLKVHYSTIELRGQDGMLFHQKESNPNIPIRSCNYVLYSARDSNPDPQIKSLMHHLNACRA